MQSFFKKNDINKDAKISGELLTKYPDLPRLINKLDDNIKRFRIMALSGESLQLCFNGQGFNNHLIKSIIKERTSELPGAQEIQSILLDYALKQREKIEEELKNPKTASESATTEVIDLIKLELKELIEGIKILCKMGIEPASKFDGYNAPMNSNLLIMTEIFDYMTDKSKQFPDADWKVVKNALLEYVVSQREEIENELNSQAARLKM